jgi:hypothetical protein
MAQADQQLEALAEEEHQEIMGQELLDYQILAEAEQVLEHLVQTQLEERAVLD